MQCLRRCFGISVILACMQTPIFGQLAENVYFDYPVAVESYDPYSFGRPLGVYSSVNQKYHLGEDFQLSAQIPISNIADGKLVRYQQNGSCSPTCQYCGYGILYAVVQYRLNRSLRVPVGVHREDVSRDFTMVYGHIVEQQDPSNPQSPKTSFSKPLSESIDIAGGEILGWIAPHNGDCDPDDLNGDGDEHLHHGSKFGLTDLVLGYNSNDESDHCPTHIVIAASRVGVVREPSFGDISWDGIENDNVIQRSEAFFNKWWEFMELDNYHNKLGRPHNNHPDASQGDATDFVHWWGVGPTPAAGFGVWVQDFYQPYAGQSRFAHGHTALIFNQDSNAVYLLKEGFWDWYMNEGAYSNLGAPLNDEYGPANNRRQDFERGYLVWNGVSVLAYNNDGIQILPRNVNIQANFSTATSLAKARSKNSRLNAQSAEIWHNGNLLGTTPLDISGYEGFTYAMVARANGYYDKPFTYDVGSADMEVSVTLDPYIPTPAGTGKLTVVTEPSGAQIYRSGTPWPSLGQLTSIFDEPLSVGNYQFTIEKTGFGTTTINFSIDSSQTTFVSVDLSPPAYPDTVEAEDMAGVGTLVPDEGMWLTTQADPQNWFLLQDIGIPDTGLVEIEVIARADGAVGLNWPRLEVKLGGGLGTREVNTSLMSCYFYKEITQGNSDILEVLLDEVTRQTAGHAVFVDKVILRYVNAPRPDPDPLPPPTFPVYGYTLDQYTIGLWNMSGALGSAGKRENQSTGSLLTEIGVGSDEGVGSEPDGSYSLTRGQSRLRTDLDTEIDGLSAFTFEGWFFFDNTQTNQLFGRWDANASMTIEWNQNGTFYVFIASSPSDPGNHRAEYPLLLQDNQWYHIAVVFDGAGSSNSDRLKLYLDGVQQTTCTFWGTIPTNLTTLGAGEPLIFGNYKDSSHGSSMGGRIGPVRVSDIARTDSEIASSANGTIPFIVSPSNCSLSPQNNSCTISVSSQDSCTVTPSVSWLNVSSSSVYGFNQMVTVTADTSGLGGGTHEAVINFVAGDSSQAVSIALEMEEELYDQFTIGYWDMEGVVGSVQKRTNMVSGDLLTEVSVESADGHAGDPNGAYGFVKANHSRLRTDIDTELNGLSQLTFELWVQFDNPNNNAFIGRLSDGDFSAEWQGANNPLYIFINNAYGYSAAQARDTNAWYHLALVYNGDGASNSEKLKLYINGNAIGLSFSGTLPGSFPDLGSNPLILGHSRDQNTGSASLGGAIAATKISNVARSPEEILQSYQNAFVKRGLNQSRQVVSLPTVFALHQNYPNPFNPETRIRFDLPKQEDVTLEIYDIVGRKVRALIVNQNYPAGQHAIIFDGRNNSGEILPSGVYHYRLTAGAFSAIRKMAFLK